MEVQEFIKHRRDLIAEAQDETGFFSSSGFLNLVLPSILDSKLIESEDYNEAFYAFADSTLKLVGYSINESAERLLLFLVNEGSLTEKKEDALMIGQKGYYDTQFNSALKFVQSAIKGELTNELQDADGTNFIINHLSSDEGLDEFDVVEIFLISATATVETRGATLQPRRINFEEDFIKIKYRRDKLKLEKELKVKKVLIDLNFLHNVLVSQGNREPLFIDFVHSYNYRIEAIKAADERFFESYLCVLPGNIIAELYKDHSSRLLEKNVRSFLQFSRKGINAGIKDTIRDEPEKFIAYNNGLTITATKKDVVEEGGKQYIKSLTDFQIVNGGQTTATIFFSRKEGIPVSGVRVMAKINIAKEATETELDQLISNISTYSNAQNRVSKVDLKARSKPMVKLKSLSDSIITPRGTKWFFERAKGELNTLIRKSGNKDAILRKYPKDRRFTKEELAKYYTAWGDAPYKVKKGGEKVFREFIEEISGEGRAKVPEIDRLFYENVIGRIIMFRGMEKIYAEAKIGNLRAATIPYSISVLYGITNGVEKDMYFNFEKLWVEESISNDLESFLLELMKLMNGLIKKYATSDDPSENSKTKELWERIWTSDEVVDFSSNADTKKIIKTWTIGKDEHKARVAKFQKKEVSFLSIQENVFIQTNGAPFYQFLKERFKGFSSREKESLDMLIDAVFKRKDLDEQVIEQEKILINKIIAQAPELLDDVLLNTDTSYQRTLDLVIAKYNQCLNTKASISSEFNAIRDQAESKQYKNAEVWGQIGEQLLTGTAPSIMQIHQASSLFSGVIADPVKHQNAAKIDEPIMKQMIEWATKKRALTANEISYIGDFAYGLKKLTTFHENNIRRYLEGLIQKGFKQSGE